jgi:hypothetical protein
MHSLALPLKAIFRATSSAHEKIRLDGVRETAGLSQPESGLVFMWSKYPWSFLQKERLGWTSTRGEVDLSGDCPRRHLPRMCYRCKFRTLAPN